MSTYTPAFARLPRSAPPRPGSLNPGSASGGAGSKEDRSIRTGATFGGLILAIYVFLLTSRVLDLSFIGYFHIPLMMLVFLTLLTLSKGGFGSALRSKVTSYFGLFTLWCFVCYPFSAWRGGSTPILEEQVQAFLVFLIILQLLQTKRDWERVTTAYAFATLTAAVMSFFIGVTWAGRVSLPNGILGDPNIFAVFMVLGLPFWWLKARRSTGFKKLLYLACTLPLYPALARAGSRSGMLALVVLFAVTFYFADGARKMLLVVTAVLGLCVAFVALPSYLRARYLTFFSSSGEDAQLGADVASSEARKMLLFQSIGLTFKHPILGVGPGVFAEVAFDERRREWNYSGVAFVSHNTYTQISSETGFPGFFFFIGSLILCLRYTISDYRRLLKQDPDFAQCARYLFYALAGLAIGIFFLSVGYTHLISIMFALAASLHLIVEAHLRGETQMPQAAVTGLKFARPGLLQSKLPVPRTSPQQAAGGPSPSRPVLPSRRAPRRPGPRQLA